MSTHSPTDRATTGPIRLDLTIEPGSEPIAGRIRLPNGTTLTFTGYVQLIEAVEVSHGLGPAHDVPSAGNGGLDA